MIACPMKDVNCKLARITGFFRAHPAANRLNWAKNGGTLQKTMCPGILRRGSEDPVHQRFRADAEKQDEPQPRSIPLLILHA